MKRILRWLCPALFLLICAGMIWALHRFVVVNGHMEYITWDSSVQILSDGTEVPFETDTYSNTSDAKGSYRFSSHLPEGLPEGSLIFETSGCSVTLSLNGTEIYRSSAATSQDVALMSQATIPLPEGTTGAITMDYTVLDSYGAMFPPLLRFMPTFFTDMQATAFANRAALPAGAAALAFLLVTSLFLLGVMSQQPDLRLLPLMGAALGLTFYQMIQEQGSRFLPEAIWQFFSRPAISLGIIFLLLLYLFVNRSRHFFRHLGIVTAWSAAGLAVAYFVSLWQDSYLSSYINSEVSILISNGFYGGLTYWLILWLTIVCAAISVYGTMRAFTAQQSNLEMLSLRSQLITDSYHAIETKMKESAALRHEMKHHLTALDALCQKNDMDGLKELLQNMLEKDERQAQIHFTKNYTVNAILQDAALRAAQSDIHFDARAELPQELPVPEQDLCILLMNMLDNALEACAKVKDADRRSIKFHADVKNGFLSISCKNTFADKPRQDRRGRFLTSKSDDLAHGFGISQMESVARKYHSVLDISYETDRFFSVQTTLQLPQENAC